MDVVVSTGRPHVDTAERERSEKDGDEGHGRRSPPPLDGNVSTIRWVENEVKVGPNTLFEFDLTGVVCPCVYVCVCGPSKMSIDEYVC